MRLRDALEHPTVHAALTNVSGDQHHLQPDQLTILNTTLVVPPLPGGPSDWDIAVPFETMGAVVHLRSVHVSEAAGGMSGAILIVTRSPIEGSGMSLGGHGVLTSGAYGGIYTKVSGATNLTHKIFDNTGASISVSNAQLVATGPATRVLRLTFTNYSAGLATLDVRGEVGLLH